MSENAIVVKNLSIHYKAIKDKSSRSKMLFFSDRLQTVEAVKDVSFEVQVGKIVGIIGRNGSGKSTLLRSIAGVFAPNSGTIELFGRSVSLLSIGVGFQNNLSGHENIFLSGLLMGFTEKQIKQRYQEIVDFSELGDFIHMPVKSYSSGMFSKLAFSITAILETDIMLIDEILSVGDAAFKKKSYAKMQQLISEKDRTVLIVSHDMGTLNRLCDEIIWIHDGRLREQGPSKDIIPKYEEFMGIKKKA